MNLSNYDWWANWAKKFARAKKEEELKALWRLADSLIVGYFLERPYGDASMLMEAFKDAYKGKPLYASSHYGCVQQEVSNKETGVICPSNAYGYQDSTCWYSLTEVSEVTKVLLVMSAYKVRSKTEHVYNYPLKEVIYNSQKGGFILPEEVKKDRSKNRQLKKSLPFQKAVSLFNLSWDKLEDHEDGVVWNKFHSVNSSDMYISEFSIDNDGFTHEIFNVVYRENKIDEMTGLPYFHLKVMVEIPELGFYEPVPLWYSVENDGKFQVCLLGCYSSDCCLTMDSDGNVASYHNSNTYWDDNPGGIANAVRLP